ncbi:DUF6011 domain-containing protein [Streptomyces sp. NPDC005548]|uniref:DUF6011 domain-containing protein n=1 Tax=Streptomyces sp. NPDC005548 TaxID=3364724 RepID=UPI0036743FCB
MTRHQQKALMEEPARARVWCRECHKELSDPVSRSRRLGPECDPEPRTAGGGRHEVDQDPIPGL